MRIHSKIAAIAATIVSSAGFASQTFAASATVGSKLQTGLIGAGASVYGGTPPELTQVIGNLINSAFYILGALLLVMLLYGGFVWMTAMGDSEKTKKARQTITNAVIGLVIIASAYALSNFIITEISRASLGGNTGVSNNPPQQTTP